MKAALCWLVLGTVPALGQVGGGQVAPFGVYTQFEHEPSPPVLQSLQGELMAILSAVGLPLEWRLLAAPREGEAFADLAVVEFKGACDIADLSPDYRAVGALGWTHITDGEVIPFSEVDCDRIRAFLSVSLLRVWPADRERVFGRAIARVTAHELYHILTQKRHHGAEGVAESAYTVSQLMAGDFWFGEAEAQGLTALAARLGAGSDGSWKLAGSSLFDGMRCAACHGAHGEGTERAPSLRANAAQLKPAQLAARLTNKSSEMYRRVRGLGFLWPSLVEPAVESLVNYLNAGLD